MLLGGYGKIHGEPYVTVQKFTWEKCDKMVAFFVNLDGFVSNWFVWFKFKV